MGVYWKPPRSPKIKESRVNILFVMLTFVGTALDPVGLGPAPIWKYARSRGLPLPTPKKSNGFTPRNPQKGESYAKAEHYSKERKDR